MAKKVTTSKTATQPATGPVMYRDAFFEAAKVGKAPSDVILRKQVAGSFEKAAAEGDTLAPPADNQRRFCISTQAVDRDNDVVAVAGWKTDNYLKNPVVLWAHDYSQLPIGKCVGLSVKDGKLMATAQFADHPMAKTVLSLIDGGYLNATSVGFKPLDYSLNQERQGMDFKQQELLEFSVVPVPANPQALIAASAAGVDLAPVKAWAEDIVKQIAATRKDGDAADDKAEMIGYSALANMVGTLRDLVAQATDAVTALVAAEQENPDGTDNPDDDDEIEAARLAVICSVCSQISGTLWAIQDLTYQLRDDDDDASVTIQLADGKSVAKAGRVISRANEERLKSARAHLDAVIQQVQAQPPADGDQSTTEDDKTKLGGESVPCPECGQPMNAPAGASCLHPGAHEVVIGKTEDKTTDGVLDVDDVEVEDVLAGMTPEDLKDVFAATFSKTALTELVTTEIQSALARARGRVD